MTMKLDHELRLTRCRSWDMQNLEADLFIMISRPSEANYGGGRTKYVFPGSRTFFEPKICLTSSRPDSCGSTRELNQGLGNQGLGSPGEGQRVTIKGYLDPKIVT